MLRKLKERVREKESRRFFVVFLAGKMLGVVLLLVALKVLAPFFHSVARRAEHVRCAEARGRRQLPEHGLDAGGGLPGLLHAGRLHDARGRLRPDPGGRQRPPRVHRRHVPVRPACSGRSASRSCSAPGNRFIGHEFFFLNGAPATYGTTGVAFMAFFLFQFAFADTCSTITSGAMVGRTGFKGDLLYSIGVSGFIYPILGHWVWGPDGWLATMPVPFRDFAGSTVVHTVGGMIALAGAIVLGPRLGRKFKPGRWRHAGRPRHDHRRHRWRDPVVRLVRLQPRLHAVGPRRRRHGPGRHEHHVGRRARARLSALFFVYPTLQEVGHGHHGQRLPRRPRRHHLSVLLGQRHSAPSSSARVAGVVVVLGVDLLEYGCGSTTRSARCPCTASAASGAR